jgi:hypothetical protein
MKKIKIVLIHMADMFDWYILHNIIDGPLVNYFWEHKWYNSLQDFHMKICTKICMSEWWSEEECNCFHCKKNNDIEE